MEIKGTNVNLNQKVKEDSQIGKKLAKEIMLFADDNSSAVSKKEFQNKLNKMEKLSTQNLIKFIYHPLLEGKIFILETPYIKLDEKSKISYPPYKFEIQTIKDRVFDPSLKEKIIEYYTK